MWKPVLEGELAQQAQAAVRDVAVALAESPEAAAPAERTLFWAYATALVDEPFAHAAYDAALDDVIALLRVGVSSPSLYDGGLAGIGFTLNHVLDGGAEDVLEVIDEALLGVLDDWDGALDLTHGIVGLGLYFTERLASNPNTRLAGDGVTRVIDHLERTAIYTDRGTTWLRDGVHDCGVAHGVPGIIGFLARAARVTAEPRAGALADDAACWLAAQRLPTGIGRFPANVPPLSAEQHARFARLGTQSGAPTSRAAWCYGDLGVASTLWRTRPELARETAAECAVRDPATCGVRDTGLCHGAGGLAHLCNRFYQATGQALYADAARAWFARTLSMRRLGGAGGFAAWRGCDDGTDDFASSFGLLDGAIGTALALCAATSSHEPGWDRALLCEV